MNNASLDFQFIVPLEATAVRIEVIGIDCTEPYIGELSDHINLEVVFDSAYLDIRLGLGDGPTLLDKQWFPIGITNIYSIRVALFNTLLAVYCNDMPVYTYTFRRVERESDADVSIVFASEDSSTMTDVIIVELADGREAIFADYESTTENALQSIIQQRPVMMVARAEPNSISFTYKATGDELETLYPKRISLLHADNTDLSSDGIVYFSEVQGISNVDVAREFGFITRLYRFPELDDITHPVKAIQERALEMTRMIEIVQRFDPRIEALDVINFDKIITGTQRTISVRGIAEDISFSIEDGFYTMTISGREDRTPTTS